MIKPICSKCQLFFRIKKNGVYFEEGRPGPLMGLSGDLQPPEWRPYKLWAGDLWECKRCRAQIIVGVGMYPIAEHFQADFKNKVAKFLPIFRVDDC